MMGNRFKDMENKYRNAHKIHIDWAKIPSERSIEIPWMLSKLDKIRPTTVLDIGFAGGFYQQDILAIPGIKYIGYDFDESRINGDALHVSTDRKNAWRNLLKRFQWVQGDIVKPEEELLQKRFATVMAISTIEHIVPAGYAGNYTDLQADLTAVENMKTLVALDGDLLLTFPVGQEQYFYNPQLNSNAAILKRAQIFKTGQHDQMFYDSARIINIIGDWSVVEKTFWRSTGNNKWGKCPQKIACNTFHETSAATTVCLLHLKPPVK